MAGVDDFNREFTELLNTYCWNDRLKPARAARERRAQVLNSAC